MDAMDRYLEEKRREDEALIQAGYDDPDSRQFEPVTDAEVDAAETGLGYRLPPSYRRLVTSTPCYEWDLINWITDSDKHRQKILLSHDEERPWLIGIHSIGDGDVYCLDARHPNEHGEYPIVRWDHETARDEDAEFEVVFPDLLTYLQNFDGDVHHGEDDPETAD